MHFRQVQSIAKFGEKGPSTLYTPENLALDKRATVWNFENFLVMGQTPFYRTSNELKHHFSNIERTRTCSSIGDRTLTPYFWLRIIEIRT